MRIVSRMKENKKPSDNYIIFNENWKYQIPMIPSSNSEYDRTEEIVEANISQNKGFVRIIKEGYRDKYFADRYFEFLISSNYIKIIR